MLKNKDIKFKALSKQALRIGFNKSYCLVNYTNTK